MKAIQLKPVASQYVSVVVGGQQCSFSIYQKLDGLYFDLTVNGVTICNTRRIRNDVPLLRKSYFNVVGDFIMIDLQGASDPTFDGLGTRYQLLYFGEGDL